MNFRSHFAHEQWLPVLGAEHQMDQEAGKGLWHFGKRIAGFQPAEIFLILTQAVGLGYWIFAPLAHLKFPNSNLKPAPASYAIHLFIFAPACDPSC
jgi:hypothetical protein